MATASPRRVALPACSPVVLLVESHEDSREMYACYPQLLGFTVLTSDSTDEGLIRASDADVVVTGIRVHGSFDGVELVDRLRHADGTRQKPIIVMTSCALGPDRQRAHAAGCTVFLQKPCLPEQLVNAIHGFGGTT
jgi:two-component system cell cycle response regulator DivK